MSSLVFCTLLGPEGPGRLVLSGAGLFLPLGRNDHGRLLGGCGHGLGLRSLANRRHNLSVDTVGTG
jgi:hypothetical protein